MQALQHHLGTLALLLLIHPGQVPQALGQGLRHLAAMDRQQHAQCAQMMLERLHEQFSDQAVRAAFWQLPHVTELTARA